MFLASCLQAAFIHSWILEQQDIAGFYNAVPHFRILQSVQILIERFRRLQQIMDPHAVLSVSSVGYSPYRAFRGTWKLLRHRVTKPRLRHNLPLTQYFLQRSYFTVGRHVFRQVEGASVGSPCAPILCGCVATIQELLFRENYSTFLQSFRSFLFAVRYVDNRAFLSADPVAGPVPWQVYMSETLTAIHYCWNMLAMNPHWDFG